MKWLGKAALSLLGGLIVLNAVLLMFMSGREVADFDRWLGASVGKAVGLVPITAQAAADGIGDAQAFADDPAPKKKAAAKKSDA